MARQCWGITKHFKRCKAERMVIPVCTKHIWQFIQLLVVIVTLGAVIVTVKMYHIYEAHLHVMEAQKNSESVPAAPGGDGASGDSVYGVWEHR